MKCKKYKISTSKYFDKELDNHKKEVLFSHISKCIYCKKEFEILKKIFDNSFSEYTYVETSPYFETKLFKKLEEKHKQTSILNSLNPKYLTPAFSLILIIISLLLTKLPIKNTKNVLYELYPEENIDITMLEYYTNMNIRDF